MSVQEFVLAFCAIVIGLGLSDLLSSLHRLFRAARRVKWDWLALSFAGVMLFLSVTYWWGSFAWYRGAASVSIAEFLPNFFYLCLSYLMMAAALPDDVPDDGVDLRQFYWASRVHRWALISVSIVVSIALGVLNSWPFNLLPFMSEMWPVFISAVLAMACVRSRRTWLHVLAIAWIGSAIIYHNLFAVIANS